MSNHSAYDFLRPEGWEENNPRIEFYRSQLPDRSKVERIFTLHGQKKGRKYIARKLHDRGFFTQDHLNFVNRILDDGISKWDWVDDDVAIKRAYQGDREVWKNLTHFERFRVLDMLSYHTVDNPHRLASANHNARHPDDERSRADHMVDRDTHGATSMNGVLEWCWSVGENPGRIMGLLAKRNQRRRAYDRAA